MMSSSSSSSQQSGGNHLDPDAQAFYPSALTLPPIYYPYHPPPPPPPPPAYDPPAGRAVLLTTVPRHLSDAAVRAAMEPFGAIRAVEARHLTSEGTVTVHFYDLRSAQAAVATVREQHVQHQSRLQQNWVPWDPAAAAGGYAGGGMLVMHHHQQQMGVVGLVAGHAVWAQFAARELDGQNQGSLVVFNWDASASASLVEIFQSFGDVKDVRDATSKPHKFVDFFDTRDAARAVAALNGREVMGRRMAVEFARLGGPTRSSGIGKRSSSNNQGCQLPPRLQRSGSGGPRIAEASVPVLPKRGEAARNSAAASCSSGDRSNKVCSGGSSNNRNPLSLASSSKQPQQSRKELKNQGKSARDRESMFHFQDVGAMVESESGCRDSRTTVMIKNIPNKYSQKLLLSMLDSHCINRNEQIGGGGDEEPLSAYDFVYLPIDFNNKCNVGYGFVNLTSPQAAVRLHKAFHMQPWEVFNSRKICEVTYARLQGLEALKRHFMGSKFACDDDEYMPVEFSPPRDGVQLTEPVPVGCRISPTKRVAGRRGSAGTLPSGASSTTASTHAPSDNADGDEVTTITTVGDDDDDGVGGCGGSDGTGSDLFEALGRLSCSQQA